MHTECEHDNQYTEDSIYHKQTHLVSFQGTVLGAVPWYTVKLYTCINTIPNVLCVTRANIIYSELYIDRVLTYFIR